MFMGENEIDQLDKIFLIMGSPSLNYWPDLINFSSFDISANQYKNDIFREGL